MRLPIFIAATSVLLLGSPAVGQRHLPDIQIFRTSVSIFLDTRIEEPAINQGISAAALPNQGEILTFQLFVPSAANQSIFEYTIELKNPNNALTNAFQVVSVTDWKEREITSLRGSSGATRTAVRFFWEKLPGSGHLATVTLKPITANRDQAPIEIRISATTVSDPPRRVWQMEGVQTLSWL